ncbi:mixed-linked glucanase [Coprinopsis cinerea okayama7|uniref:Mixed-linked glucanase n=1 Tax=Coprinopsis cinerea (strain Okayama-7 / 130 / ATCC MYA-4618 / FGSC 9003) TaxID=240176 RepID=A8PBB6_COPC7|nr:mixed-linked glucanase [Coprinopsis cinerea okayama7\|eukprot:XP_001840142.2 mixed-linked glucanase [Coprinopsis cinerea okayama7\
MRPPRSLTFAFLSAYLFQCSLGQGGTYTFDKEIRGDAFFNEFEWESMPDPTHGRVNYVDKQTSIAQRLTYVNDEGQFVLRADDQKVVGPEARGRDSVRIRSVEQFTTHVAVFDIAHMPVGCGTWPALWTVGRGWPNGGEIDILEGVNDETPNAATLHTGTGCVMPGNDAAHKGQRKFHNCDARQNSNIGCPVEFDTPLSYGPPFNQAGGGWYAMERNSAFIKIWFWSRSDANVPESIRTPGGTADPSQWGEPSAFFPGDTCNMDQFFIPHWIVINLTFCGDWAGAVYHLKQDCPGTCVDHVNNQPQAFSQARWEINSIRIYK